MAGSLIAGSEVGVSAATLVGDLEQVAAGLLNAIVIHGTRAGRIVEVEAYGGADDPASHAYRGRTARNGSMFAAAGTLYCYRAYGLHVCANVVTGAADEPQAVLIRALEPLRGLAEMRSARPAARRDVDLANGPGKLCEALGITHELDGVDLCARGSSVRLLRDGLAPPDDPLRSTRIGITRAVTTRWRFAVREHPCLSRRPGRGDAKPARS